jgi:hypothetical protein
MQAQLDRMANKLCDKNFCSGKNSDYRCPNCCAFLRPTDKLIDQYSPLQSSGFHIQICDLDSFTEAGPTDKILYRKDIENRTLSNKSFDELFKKNFIGSRWLNLKEVDEIYKGLLINDHLDSFVLHATEIED